MNDKLMKMIEKKKKSSPEMSSMEQGAKMKVLGDLQDAGEEGLMDKLHNMKKVSVMSNSQEGMEKGLEKAKEVVKDLPGAGNAAGLPDKGEESPQAEMVRESDGMSHEDEKEPDLSEEEIDEHIGHLMALKQRLRG